MGFFTSLKNAFTVSSNPNAGEYDQVIEDTVKEYAATQTHSYFYNIKISDLQVYTNGVINWSDKKKIDFILYCIQKMHNYYKNRNTFTYGDKESQTAEVCSGYVKHLFKARLLLDDTDVEQLVETFSNTRKFDWTNILTWPLAPMLNQIQKQYAEQELTEKMVSALNSLKKTIKGINNQYREKEILKLTEKIDHILFKAGSEEGEVKPTLFLAKDDFSDYANKVIEDLPTEEKKIWYKLITKAHGASGSKPSKKYLDETKTLFKELGTDKFKKVVNDWFLFLTNLKEKTETHTTTFLNQTYHHTTGEFISTINSETIKGFVWMCSHFHDSATIYTIANLAERSYRKIPGKGPASAAIGNGCLYTLYKSKGLDGIGQLSRLKLRVKQSSTQAIIEKYLLAAAKEQGVSLHEIEDLAVENFELNDGKKEFQFDEYKAEIIITGTGSSELNWYKPDGSLQKSVPASVKGNHAAKLKKVIDTQKQIDQTTSAQRDRIDRMLRSERKWKMSDFTTLYLQHGLMSFHTKKIIWIFTCDGKSQSAIWFNNRWVNSSGEAVVPDETSEVSLWHPAQQTIVEIKSWRDFLVANRIQQPLKQAYREVYLLTEAEVNTRSYSNRMAAHVLKQHQFNSLAKHRGWKYALMGAFDNGVEHGIAEVKLGEYNLLAQYWVNELNADGALNDTGIWNYVTTDQIRFVNTDTNEPVELVNVPPVLFSEVLRDVDLFVGVASVGNDPTWQDSGGVPAYRDYWQSYSFGDLSEVAKSRKEILTGLVPRLKISKVAEIKDKFLVVKGKLRTYKIHIGSTNIMMEPNDQYLCIVPDRSKKSFTENLFIPFEGDTGLSIILSKAFLLAEDDKITDSTITSQINRK